MKNYNFRGAMIEWKIIFFRTYLIEMEKALKEKEADLKKKWEDIKKDCQDEREEYLIDCSEELKQQFGFFYASFIMIIYSFLEDKLNEICEISSIKSKLKIKLKDMKGRGIHRAKLFMEKICDLALPDEKLWKELEGIGLIRNCLVHSDGETNNEQLVIYAKKRDDIKIEESPYIKIKTIKVTKNYCDYAMGVIDNYLLTLTDLNRNNL